MIISNQSDLLAYQTLADVAADALRSTLSLQNRQPVLGCVMAHDNQANEGTCKEVPPNGFMCCMMHGQVAAAQTVHGSGAADLREGLLGGART